MIIMLFAATAAAQTVLRNGRYRAHDQMRRVSGTVVGHQFHGTFTTRSKFEPPYPGKPYWYVSEIKTYVNGELHGPAITFYSNGDTMEAGAYCHDRYCGTWTYYENRRLTNLNNYDSLGNRTGGQYRYDRNGVLAGKEVYSAPGTWYSWLYDDGRLLSRGAYSSKGREGTWYDYAEIIGSDPRDTLPVLICEWKDGKQNGWCRTFARGVPTEECQRCDGVLNGTYRAYRKGLLIVDSTYEMGKRNGTEHAYTWGGKLGTVREWKNETLHGTEINYDTLTRKVQEEIMYNLGVVVQRRQWDTAGHFVYEEQLVNPDSSHYTWRRYFPNGKVSAYGERSGHGATGAYGSYYENGNRKISARYVRGEYVDAISVWNPKGVLVYRASLCSGFACDDETVRDDNGRLLTRGTDAYTVQVKKYAPQDLATFDAYGYQYPVVVISRKAVWPAVNGRLVTEPAAESMQPPADSCTSPRCPQFPGGETARVRWLQAHVFYPELEREMERMGTCYIAFTVKADGAIENVRVAKDVEGAPSFAKEAMRVVKAMPQWVPAKQNGKAVDRQCVMPIRFVLL